MKFSTKLIIGFAAVALFPAGDLNQGVQSPKNDTDSPATAEDTLEATAEDTPANEAAQPEKDPRLSDPIQVDENTVLYQIIDPNFEANIVLNARWPDRPGDIETHLTDLGRENGVAAEVIKITAHHNLNIVPTDTGPQFIVTNSKWSDIKPSISSPQ